MSDQSSKPEHPGGGEESEDVEVIRYYNDAAIGLEMLYQAARIGAPGAKEQLRDLAERITVRAGNLGHIR